VKGGFYYSYKPDSMDQPVPCLIHEPTIAYGTTSATAGAEHYRMISAGRLETIGGKIFLPVHKPALERRSILDWLERNQKLLLKYRGKWVAVTPSKGIIGYGTDAGKVFRKAYKSNPDVVMHYVPEKEIDLLF